MAFQSIHGFNIIIVFLLLLSFLKDVVYCQSNFDEDAERKIQGLYNVIRSVALPGAADGRGLTKRFVLNIPGKVLNQDDYNPGPDYLAFVRNPTQGRFQEIPPIKQQNLFRLVDIMPGVEPLLGSEDGTSFSILYGYALGQLDIRGIREASDEITSRVKETVDFLQFEKPDPEDKSILKTRWELYRKYERLYNEERELLEETIERERLSRSSINYQIWFQRNYPTLQAEVDGAYMDWLVNGDKDIVELYRARLDTSSPGTLLQEAKAAMRASGVVALDRSSTVYPVDYTPSNWFEYLQDPVIRFTPDQMRVRIGQMRAQVKLLEAIISYYATTDMDCDIDTVVGELSSNVDSSNAEITTNVSEIMSLRCQCASKSYRGIENNDCSNYLTKSTEILDDIQSHGATFQLHAALDALKTGNTAVMNDIVASINTEITKLERRLASTGAGLPGVVTRAAGESAAAGSPPSAWLSFSYDSTESSQYSRSTQSYTSSRVTTRVSIGWFSASSTVARSKRTADSYMTMSQSNVRVYGEVLRVNIRFPWFRPELFRSNRFFTIGNENVAPGIRNDQTDRNWIDEVTTNTYLLPQYITGFLLARNLSMEFSSTDSSSTSSFIAESLSVNTGVSVGPLSISASYMRSTQEATFQAESTSSGLRIGVPGVQMIGYYTDIVPKFPQ